MATRQLLELGYAEQQIEAMNPEARPVIAFHHSDLTAKGFSHAMLSGMSRWHRTVPFLALCFNSLKGMLPSLGPAEFSTIAGSRDGAPTLATLLQVTNNLKAAPVQLDDTQIFEVARRGGRSALQALNMLGQSLSNGPLQLTSNHLVNIAVQGGARSLLTLHKLGRDLLNVGLTTEQIVTAAASRRAQALLSSAVYTGRLEETPRTAASRGRSVPNPQFFQDACDPLVEPGSVFELPAHPDLVHPAPNAAPQESSLSNRPTVQDTYDPELEPINIFDPSVEHDLGHPAPDAARPDSRPPSPMDMEELFDLLFEPDERPDLPPESGLPHSGKDGPPSPDSHRS